MPTPPGSDLLEGSKRKGFQVLYDGREMKFVTRRREAACVETMVGFELRCRRPILNNLV